MKINVFTNVNLVLLLLGYVFGLESTLWKISCCNTFGSTMSFSCVPFFDSLAYKKQRKKNNFSLVLFYTGHIVLHVLPCMFIYYNLPENMNLYTCVSAFGLKLLWAYFTCGSIYLDSVYVPLEKSVWEKVWLVSFVSHFIPVFSVRLL